MKLLKELKAYDIIIKIIKMVKENLNRNARVSSTYKNLTLTEVSA